MPIPNASRSLVLSFLAVVLLVSAGLYIGGLGGSPTTSGMAITDEQRHKLVTFWTGMTDEMIEVWAFSSGGYRLPTMFWRIESETPHPSPFDSAWNRVTEGTARLLDRPHYEMPYWFRPIDAQRSTGPLWDAEGQEVLVVSLHQRRHRYREVRIYHKSDAQSEQNARKLRDFLTAVPEHGRVRLEPLSAFKPVAP